MAIDKPWRHIEVRPKALHDGKHHNCMHSLIDKTKITKVPNHYLQDIYYGNPDNGLDKIKENEKVKRLIRRRKLRQKYNASKV